MTSNKTDESDDEFCSCDETDPVVDENDDHPRADFVPLHERLNAEETSEEIDQEEVVNADDDDFIDDSYIADTERYLSPAQLQSRQEESAALKQAGNEFFWQADYEKACSTYSNALWLCPLENKLYRSVLFANRAACKVRKESYASAAKDCTRSIELNPGYVKVLMRRADVFEKLEKFDEALQDYQTILTHEPNNLVAREACMRLPEVIKVRNEKLKEEMLGKLKDLGNMVLKPFGLSTDNFKMQQDPNTGSYSVNFQQ